MSSAICFNLDQSKILSSGNGINRAENTVDKGENAGYQYFLLFSQCFPKLS